MMNIEDLVELSEETLLEMLGEETLVGLGKKIYDEALRGRKGFDMFLDEETWREIYLDMGQVAASEALTLGLA